jgi:hypothetical protein
MWRPTNDDEFRRDLGNLMPRLMDWIGEENSKRRKPLQRNPLLPTFGNLDTMMESLTASGGHMTGRVDDTRDQFTIGLHATFKVQY